MQINDRVYGRIIIEDPFILQLIQTAPFQRLKRINQYGGVNFIYPNKYQITRFEHSIGVWHILKTLNTSLEVQIAGLLHDIGHTAFSHMVDHALGNENENFHEHNLELIEDWNKITVLLKNKNINLKPVDTYSEVKMQMPYIGADRLDYGLRDYIGATNKDTKLGTEILKDILLQNNQIVFQTESIAKEFAITGLEAMWLVIYDPQVAVVYAALSDILKQGLNEKWIEKKDLYKDDQFVMDIIKSNKHKLSEKYMQLFSSSFKISKGSKNNHDFVHKKLKLRFFDPLVMTVDQPTKLSELNSAFAEELQSKIKLFNSAKQGTYFLVTFKK